MPHLYLDNIKKFSAKFFTAFKFVKTVYNAGTAHAFTLAEVLITLAIIGVVVAITIPAIINNVQNHIRSEQIRTAKYKFTKATTSMQVDDLIGPYDSTTAFVQELSKYLKIAKICDVEHLVNCFGYETINLDEGKTFDVKKIKTGKNLMMDDSYSSDNVGLITLDGTSMILSYKTDCEQMSGSELLSWSTEDNKPVTNDSANCVAMVMDINGGTKPNTLKKDVALFNANGIGNECAIELSDGSCFGAPFSAGYFTDSQCQAKMSELGIRACGKTYGKNYFAAAAAACGGVSYLPSDAQLAEIASLIYDGNPSIKSYKTVSGLSYTSGSATSYGLPEPTFRLWSSVNNSCSTSIFFREFASNKTTYYSTDCRTSSPLTICKLE